MRPTNGLNFLAAYTLGHAMDHVSGLNIGGEKRPVLPVTIGDDASVQAALAQEKGDALFDVRHRFVLSFGYELPKLADKGAGRAHVLGGWQLNGIFQAQTGFPLTVTDTVLDLDGLTNRPNMTCDPNDGAPHTAASVVQHQLLQPRRRGGEHGRPVRRSRATRSAVPASTGPTCRSSRTSTFAKTHADPDPRRGLQPLQPGAFRPAGGSQRGGELRPVTSADDGRIDPVGREVLVLIASASAAGGPARAASRRSSPARYR